MSNNIKKGHSGERKVKHGFFLEVLAQKGKEGDRTALEELVKRIQDRIYGLSLRMLYHPVDAEDAAQEILLKIVTHLGGFRGESAFTTWMFRIATNHLLNVRRSQKECKAGSFKQLFARRQTIDSQEPKEPALCVAAWFGALERASGVSPFHPHQACVQVLTY